MRDLKDALNESIEDITESEICYRGDTDKFDLNHFDTRNLKHLGQFLKGKNYETGLSIYVKKSGKYLHIHRYSDMHRMSIGVVLSTSQDWPEEAQWRNAAHWNGEDDRQSQNVLIDLFINWLNSHMYEFED